MILTIAPLEDANALCAEPAKAETACAEMAKPREDLSLVPAIASSGEDTTRFAPLGIRARMLESRYP
ncbi:MAG: hypothetical protein EOP11_23625 [Proteobacteria bacterium]|nr:MAG: hypothetical protein EOP11_23625 [Pseudomonadota bacterium]